LKELQLDFPASVIFGGNPGRHHPTTHVINDSIQLRLTCPALGMFLFAGAVAVQSVH